MRKRTARMLWLAAGLVALGLLAIGATSYVMRLDQQAEKVGNVPIGGSMAASHAEAAAGGATGLSGLFAADAGSRDVQQAVVLVG